MSSGHVDPSAVRVDDSDQQSSGNDAAERERGEPGAGAAGDHPSKERPGGGGEDVPPSSAGAAANETESGAAEANHPNGQSGFHGQQQADQFQYQTTKFPYGGYHPQGTPPPPSPTVGSTGGYDIQSLLMQQQAAMAQQQDAAAGTAGSFGTQYNSGVGVPPAPPLTPTHAAPTITTASNNVPPASPLFTAPSPLVYPRNPLNRLDSPAISKMAESSMASPLSPLPYLTPQALPGSPAVAGYGGILQGGGGGAAATNRDGTTNPSLPGAGNVGAKPWSDSSLLSPQQQQQQHHGGFQQQQDKGSPYLQPHNVPGGGHFQLGISSSESNHSSHSFDEMLPPSAAYGGGRGGDPSQGGMYPYPSRPVGVPPVGMSQGGAGGNAGPYSSHPQWGGGFYSGNRVGPPGPYGPQGGSWNVPGGGGGGYREQQRGPYPGGRPVGPPLGSGGVGGPGPGQNYIYAATTPGPPIQTSPCNKGPDGANLFIFHIPNHFTNLDMYNLFCHYGNLLSVRIMVDKDTGRSRGFGFVSYDSPDAAAMAIKELNGFVIGNKRLKVQHKQIRPSEQAQAQQQMGGGGGGPSPPPQHYQHPQQQQYHAPPSVGTLTTESSTTGAETVESSGGQLSQWHNPPPSSVENPTPPSGGAPFAPLEGGGRTVGGETVGPHPSAKTGEGIGGMDSPGVGANDESIGGRAASQIRNQDGHGQVPSNGKDGGPNLSQQVGGMSSAFPAAAAAAGGAATNVAGSSDTSPLAHLDSIRNALPE